MLYYGEGLTQAEIAARMGVSRATIVNYLRLAREQGIVDIRIRGDSLRGTPLSRDLAHRFGLAEVYVATDDADPLSAEAMTDRTARLAAMAMHDLLVPGDRLGIAWGDTVQRVAHAFPQRAVPDLTVCQIIGSMHANQLFAAENCTIEIARKTGAECRTLHAPAIVSTADLAASLRAEPIIARQLAELGRLTKALFSVGHIAPDTTLVAAGIGTKAELAAHKAAGAAAILAGHFIDAGGTPMLGDLRDRMLGITPEALARVPTRMLVTSGPHKLDATRAVLAGAYVTHLVIDETSAESLLTHAV